MTAAQAAEAVGTAVVAEDLSLEGCAENIKRIYKERYPEQAEMIEEIVDTVSANEEFIYIFERNGASAFGIIENTLERALVPSVSPVGWNDDTYYTDYPCQKIQQAKIHTAALLQL